MAEVIFALICLGLVLALAMTRVSLRTWAIAAAAITLGAQLGLAQASCIGRYFRLWSLLGWLAAGLLFAASLPEIKRKYITLPAYRALKGAMPTISRNRTRGARSRHGRLGRRAVLRHARLGQAPPRRRRSR